MASVSIKIPDRLKKQIEERSEEEGYMNSSEYIRQAVREKIKQETQLYPDEIRRLIIQGEDPEDEDNLSLEKTKEQI